MLPSNQGKSLFGLYIIQWVTVLQWGLAILRSIRREGNTGDSVFEYTEHVYLLMTEEVSQL